ncbi:conserved hypothetical protein, partial [Trichinella spiralis]|uniref:hypothetical protein n=1 Tax=Trichinella spiralis TaxID=6334 RepID=UPI0001EFE0D6
VLRELFAEIFNELPFLTNTFNCTWRKSKQYDNAYDMMINVCMIPFAFSLNVLF